MVYTTTFPLQSISYKLVASTRYREGGDVRRRPPDGRWWLVMDGPDWRQFEKERETTMMVDHYAPVFIHNDNSIDDFVGRDSNRAETFGR